MNHPAASHSISIHAFIAKVWTPVSRRRARRRALARRRDDGPGRQPPENTNDDRLVLNDLTFP